MCIIKPRRKVNKVSHCSGRVCQRWKSTVYGSEGVIICEGLKHGDGVSVNCDMGEEQTLVH